MLYSSNNSKTCLNSFQNSNSNFSKDQNIPNCKEVIDDEPVKSHYIQESYPLQIQPQLSANINPSYINYNNAYTNGEFVNHFNFNPNENRVGLNQPIRMDNYTNWMDYNKFPFNNNNNNYNNYLINNNNNNAMSYSMNNNFNSNNQNYYYNDFNNGINMGYNTNNFPINYNTTTNNPLHNYCNDTLNFNINYENVGVRSNQYINNDNNYNGNYNNNNNNNNNNKNNGNCNNDYDNYNNDNEKEFDLEKLNNNNNNNNNSNNNYYNNYNNNIYNNNNNCIANGKKEFIYPTDGCASPQPAKGYNYENLDQQLKDDDFTDHPMDLNTNMKITGPGAISIKPNKMIGKDVDESFFSKDFYNSSEFVTSCYSDLLGGNPELEEEEEEEEETDFQTSFESSTTTNSNTSINHHRHHPRSILSTSKSKKKQSKQEKHISIQDHGNKAYNDNISSKENSIEVKNLNEKSNYYICIIKIIKI